MYKYQINIYWCNADKIFVALVPELLGCMAHGNTQEEALGQINIAIKMWIESALESGWEIPEPKGVLDVA